MSSIFRHATGAVVLLVTVVLYLTLACVVQNLLMLRKAKKLAAISRMPAVVNYTAYTDSGTKRTRILAFWIGWVFNKAFKKLMKSPDSFPCETCHSKCHSYDNFEFTELQQLERSLKSVVYKPYICENGHITVEKEIPFTIYHECPRCNGITVKMTEDEIAIRPTYTRTGLGKKHYACQYCDYRTFKEYEIPMLEEPEKEREDHHSSSSSSGSFGGGRSGGGGYSGKW